MPPDVKLTYRGARITILAGPYIADSEPTEQATECYLDLFGRLDDLRQFAAAQLLGVYNDAWADDDEPLMDQKTFAARLVNPAIVLGNEIGDATIYLDDSDLFGGHGIEIVMEGATPIRASLVG